MLLDVNSPLPGQSINRGDPGSSYDTDYLTRVFGIVEAFKNYPNTLGFFGGNEVINEQSVESVPSYIRVCCLPRTHLLPKRLRLTLISFLSRLSTATSRTTSPNTPLAPFLSATPQPTFATSSKTAGLTSLVQSPTPPPQKPTSSA